VSTGNGCQLTLDCTPTVVDSGTLSLAFTYADNSGATKNGTVAVSYVSSSDNNIVGTVAPSGQITALVGATQAATVTFTTEDGASASTFSVTSLLSALPSGWNSAAPSLACASVATGNGCELILTYAPTAAAAGTHHFTITSHVYLCAVSGQTVSNCAVSDGGATFSQPTDIVIH
jgi:hypothetical protein